MPRASAALVDDLAVNAPGQVLRILDDEAGKSTREAGRLLDRELAAQAPVGPTGRLSKSHKVRTVVRKIISLLSKGFSGPPG